MDLNQPWEARGGTHGSAGLYVGGHFVAVISDPDVAAQILLWARAEEVQRRRGWGVERAYPEQGGLWVVLDEHGEQLHGGDPNDDSFSAPLPKSTPSKALVAADEWLTAQERPPCKHATGSADPEPYPCGDADCPRCSVEAKPPGQVGGT